MEATSSAWFTSQPEYNTITILDGDSIDSDDDVPRQQAIDSTSDSESDDNGKGFTLSKSVDLDKSFEELHVGDTVTVIDTTALARNLDLVVEIHEDNRERERTLSSLSKRSAKYTYFSTSDSDDDIPRRAKVEEKRSARKSPRSPSPRQMSTFDALAKKLHKMNHIPQITDSSYQHLNEHHPYVDGAEPPLFSPPSTISMSKGHTLPENKRDRTMKVTLTKKDRERMEQSRKALMNRPVRDPTQEKPPPITYKFKKIPDNPPSFFGREKVVYERKPRKEQTAPMWRERRVRRMPDPVVEKIPEVNKKKVGNHAPSCMKNPEQYERAKIKERVAQKYPSLAPPPPVSAEIDVDGFRDDISEGSAVSDFPRDRKSMKQQLSEMLEENSDIEEWEVPEVKKYVESDQSDFNDEDDFAIGEEFLTDNEDDIGLIRPKPRYYDPHETRAVKLRNQCVKQRLALKETQRRLEEEDEDEREWKRKRTAKQIAPALRQLEAMSTFRKEDINEKRKRKDRDNMDRAVAPLCSAIRSAENTDFMVNRETKIVQRRSELNARKHEQRERELRREEEVRKIRGQKKKRLMQLWQP